MSWTAWTYSIAILYVSTGILTWVSICKYDKYVLGRMILVPMESPFKLDRCSCLGSSILCTYLLTLLDLRSCLRLVKVELSLSWSHTFQFRVSRRLYSKLHSQFWPQEAHALKPRFSKWQQPKYVTSFLLQRHACIQDYEVKMGACMQTCACMQACISRCMHAHACMHASMH